MVGQPYGRCTLPSDSRGHEAHKHWIPLRSPTKGSANTDPQVGPIVISKIHYNPKKEPEYLELMNISNGPASLFDLSKPQVPWRIDDIGDFVLPSNLVLRSGETLLLTNSDPSILRSTYAIPTDTQIIGPYPGRLRNDGERITLERPTERLPNGVVNFATVNVFNMGMSGLDQRLRMETGSRWFVSILLGMAIRRRIGKRVMRMVACPDVWRTDSSRWSERRVRTPRKVWLHWQSPTSRSCCHSL